MASDYAAFDAQAEDAASPPTPEPRLPKKQTEEVAVAVNTELKRFVRNTLPLMTADQLKVLVSHLPAKVRPNIELGESAEADNKQTYDASFSIKDELALQIQAVQALRQHVFPGGKLKEGASVREAKEVATTCNQMLKTLMDSHERIMNMERMRAVEAATLDVLADLDDHIKDRFLDILERKLAEIE